MITNNFSTYKTSIKAPIERVWDALVNPEMVKQYFFGSSQETNWHVGSPILWTGEYEGKMYVDKGIVLEFLPNNKLSYSYLSSWSEREDKLENYLFVSYELKNLENETELTIKQSNYDKEMTQHSTDNWVIVIDGLKRILEK